MKKIILILTFLFCFIGGIVEVKAIENPTEVSFIYINGSNNLTYKNRLKFEDAFIKNVNNLHPQIVKQIELDAKMKELFLKNAKYKINPIPIIFYWGDKSINVIKVLDRDLEAASKYSPKIAHQVRSLFAHCLHDAVWVQKRQNMVSVNNDLHKIVQEEIAKGKKVVLLGYSAGSFVTYQYYLNKANFIIPRELIKGRYNRELDNVIDEVPVSPTCFEALVDAGLVKYNPEKDKYYPEEEAKIFKEKYLKLDNYTKTLCFDVKNMKGIVGFASPVRLFYSEFTDKNSSLNNISNLMGKSIIENDIFYLTVNYNNDPFGFANGENYTYEEIKQNVSSGINKGGGFIYNKSDNYVPRTFIAAHMVYWQTAKRFSKAIVKAFNEGYKHFYGLED